MSKIELLGNYDFILGNNLCTLSRRNMIAYFSKSEKDIINTIKECITEEDLGFLDIALDLSDFDKMKPMIESVQADEYESMKKHYIVRQYLLFKIMKKANLDKEYSISDLEQSLYSGSVDELYNADTPYDFTRIDDELRRKAKDTATTGDARIHFFLDEVNDETLQLCINDLYAIRGAVGMMGYTTKERVLLATTNWNSIQDVHDYMSYKSDKRQEEDDAEIKKYMKGFMI